MVDHCDYLCIAMKKMTVVILLFCYLAASAGVIVNYHFCMDKLASAKLFEKKSKKCGKCGMHIENSHGCCRDEVTIIKMEDDQKIGQSFSYSLPALEPLSQEPSDFIITSFYNTPLTRHYQSHAPPFISGQGTYLLYSVFRI